jgi:hypothetical protein
MKLKQSVYMMEAYLKEGELNPEIVSTYKGFLRIFAAWIFDESLPWTTGEAPTLQMLFKYLKVTYPLPSDTTVRNQLAQIFAELHGKIVLEFSVHLPLLQRPTRPHPYLFTHCTTPLGVSPPIHNLTTFRTWDDQN